MIKVNVLSIPGEPKGPSPRSSQISPHSSGGGGGVGGLPKISINLGGGIGMGPPTPSSSHQPQIGHIANEHLIRIVLEVRDNGIKIQSKQKQQAKRKHSGMVKVRVKINDNQDENDDCSNKS